MSPLNSLIEKLFSTQATASQEDPLAGTVVNTQIRWEDQWKMYAPLLELQDQRRLLQVEVPRGEFSHSYQSMILGIDFLRREIILDALTPMTPHYPVIEGDTLIVSHRAGERVLRISGPCTGVRRADDDGLLYIMPLPNEIGYQQRRFYPRLNTQDYRPISVKLRLPEQCFGRIQNISAGGMRVAVGGNVTRQLRKDAQLPLCEFDFDEQLRIRCRAQIKSYRFCRKPYAHTQISLAFTDMPVQQRLRLQSTIAFLLESLAEPATGDYNPHWQAVSCSNPH